MVIGRFIKKATWRGLNCYAVSTHLYELVLEPPPKKILDPPMSLFGQIALK